MPRVAEPHWLAQAIAWRATAIGPFAVSALANMAYGMLRHARGLRSPGLAELCLCLVAFTTMWCGVLLLLHGRRLFHPARHREPPPVTSDPLHAVSFTTFADRHAMAQMLTTRLLLQAQAAHRRSQPRGVERTQEILRSQSRLKRGGAVRLCLGSAHRQDGPWPGVSAFDPLARLVDDRPAHPVA